MRATMVLLRYSAMTPADAADDACVILRRAAMLIFFSEDAAMPIDARYACCR